MRRAVINNNLILRKVHCSVAGGTTSVSGDIYCRSLSFLLKRPAVTVDDADVVRSPLNMKDDLVINFYAAQKRLSIFPRRLETSWPDLSFSPCNAATIAAFLVSCPVYYLGSVQSFTAYIQPGSTHSTNESHPNQGILAMSPSTSNIDGMKTTKLAVWKVIRSIRSGVERLVQILCDAFSVAIRATEIGVILSPLVVLCPAAYTLAYFNKQGALSQQMEHLTWSYLLQSIQMLGPAFVKLTQWAATRRDLLSPTICEQLSTLHTSNIIHSWNHTDHLLCQAFGSDYSEKLKIHPKDIVGSGCVAQVYKGVLIVVHADSKQQRIPVAIKVLHPRISQMIERDLKFIKQIAFLVDSLPIGMIRAMSLPRIVESFEDIIRRQVDLRIEARNLRRFHTNFSTNEGAGQVTGIAFPKPVTDWESTNVLVEDLIAGETTFDDIVDHSSSALRRVTTKTTVLPISAFLADTSDEGLDLRRKLARPLLESFLKMLFGDNFVHCDLHPGNVYVKTTQIISSGESKEKTQHTIVFLDAGIAASLSPQGQRNLRDLFKAVVLNDGETAGRLMVERARHERCSQVDGGVEAFSKGISDIVGEFHDNRKQGLTLGAVRIGVLLGKVLDQCRLHGVEIDPSMASIVLSTVILEGLGRSLEPDLNLIEFAIPFIMGRYTSKVKVSQY